MQRSRYPYSGRQVKYCPPPIRRLDMAAAPPSAAAVDGGRDSVSMCLGARRGTRTRRDRSGARRVGGVRPMCVRDQAVATPHTAATASGGKIVAGDNAAPHCASPLLPTPRSAVRTTGRQNGAKSRSVLDGTARKIRLDASPGGRRCSCNGFENNRECRCKAQQYT